jgi:hypothetical protein
MCMISIVTMSQKALRVCRLEKKISLKFCLQAPLILKPSLLFSSDMVTSYNVQVTTYQQLHYGCPLRGQFTVSRTRKMFSPAYIVYPTTHRDCLLLDCKVQNKMLFSLLTYFPLLPLPKPFLAFFLFFSDSESKVWWDGRISLRPQGRWPRFFLLTVTEPTI